MMQTCNETFSEASDGTHQESVAAYSQHKTPHLVSRLGRRLCAAFVICRRLVCVGLYQLVVFLRHHLSHHAAALRIVFTLAARARRMCGMSHRAHFVRRTNHAQSGGRPIRLGIRHTAIRISPSRQGLTTRARIVRKMSLARKIFLGQSCPAQRICGGRK